MHTTYKEPLLKGYRGYLAAALTGFLYYCSLPGVDWWLLSFFVWAPWMLALKGASRRAAILQGVCISLISGFLGFYWLLETLKQFSGFGTGLCLVLMTILLIYQGGRFSLMGWLVVRAREKGWSAGLTFTLAFIASEMVWPLLFPFSFGVSLHGAYPLVQIAELGGPTLVALITVSTSWALALLIEAKVLASETGIRRGWAPAFVQVGRLKLILLLSVPFVVGIYGVVRIVQVDEVVASAEKVRVGIVQANMGLEGKRSDIDEGLKRHRNLTSKLRQQGAELVVWSETSVAAAIPEEYVAQYYERRVTNDLNVPAIIGAVLSRDVEGPKGYDLFNSALSVDRKGKITGRYDKHFLQPFGEYLPFGELFPVLYDYSPQSGRFTAGQSLESLKIDGHEIATFICYEDIVPSFVNQLMRQGSPELLVNMTNDAWFGDTIEPWGHMALAKIRSIEQRRFLVRATNSGISGFIDPVGRLLQETPVFEQAAIIEDVAWLKLDTPYRIFGNFPLILSTIAIFLMTFIKKSRFSKKNKNKGNDSIADA